MPNIGTVDKLKHFLQQLIDPPVTVFIDSALKTLISLDAIKDNKLTTIKIETDLLNNENRPYNINFIEKRTN